MSPGQPTLVLPGGERARDRDCRRGDGWWVYGGMGEQIRAGPLLGARGGDRFALALISLALDEGDGTAVPGRGLRICEHRVRQLLATARIRRFRGNAVAAHAKGHPGVRASRPDARSLVEGGVSTEVTETALPVESIRRGSREMRSSGSVELTGLAGTERRRQAMSTSVVDAVRSSLRRWLTRTIVHVGHMLALARCDRPRDREKGAQTASLRRRGSGHAKVVPGVPSFLPRCRLGAHDGSSLPGLRPSAHVDPGS
jgi:hypothetical protein